MINTIKCHGDVGIRRISELKSEIMAALQANASIVIDAPGDVRADISFLQLIEAARVQARLNDKHIALAAPADGALLDVLTRGGFLASGRAQDAEFWLHEDNGR